MLDEIVLFLLKPWVLLLLALGYLYKRYFWSDYTPPRISNPVVLPFPKGKGKTLPLVSPLDCSTLGELAAYTEEQVAECVAAARKAQKPWGTTSFAERRAVLSDLMNYIVEHAEEVTKLSCQESGKTQLDAANGEVLTTCEKIRGIIANGETALKPENRMPALLLALMKKVRIEYVPRGVIGIIVPFNYPFHNAMSHIVTALFAGNAALVKASEWGSVSAAFIHKMCSTVLASRGHDPRLVQVLVGYGETGAALIKSKVDKVLFIGSPKVGKLVMRSCAESLTPVTLELGGKDPFIVRKDANIDFAVQLALRGVFFNCGQNCIAAERIYLHEAIFEEFKSKAKALVDKFRQGNTLEKCVDIGAITMPLQLKIIDELVKDALAKGADPVAGAEINPDIKKGYYYKPTILANLNSTMKIVNEETFGPVMLLFKFKTDEEAIRLANDSEFGLGCSIISEDRATAEKMSKKMETGMVTINDFGVPGLMAAEFPWGGVKKSGFGAFGGPEGIRDFAQQKAICQDRWPLISPVPPFLQFPAWPNSHKIMIALARIFYARDWTLKTNAVKEVIQLVLKGNTTKKEE